MTNTNIIILHPAPFTTKYILCKDPEGKYFVLADRSCVECAKIAIKNSIRVIPSPGETTIEGGGEIQINFQEKVIKFFGYSGGFGSADHVLAAEVAAEDVMRFVKENFEPEYHNYKVIGINH